MKKTIDILNELKLYLETHFNEKVEEYNSAYNLSLKKVNRVSYTSTSTNLPEIFLTIDRTNFEYSNITKNEHFTLINDLYVYLTFKSNENDFLKEMEFYGDIMVNLFSNYYSENINNVVIEFIERGEFQDKNIQLIKIFMMKLKLYSFV